MLYSTFAVAVKQKMNRFEFLIVPFLVVSYSTSLGPFVPQAERLYARWEPAASSIYKEWKIVL